MIGNGDRVVLVTVLVLVMVLIPAGCEMNQSSTTCSFEPEELPTRLDCDLGGKDNPVSNQRLVRNRQTLFVSIVCFHEKTT